MQVTGTMKRLFLFFLLCIHCHLPAEYVSVCGFRDCCQFAIENKQTPFAAEQVKDGDAIFVKNRYTEFFFKHYHPLIRAKYVLVTHFSDNSSPGKCAAYLDDPKLLAWFAENVEEFSHPKLIPIPVGLNNSTIEKPTHLKTFEAAMLYAHTSQRTIPLYINYLDRKETRERAITQQLFKDKKFCVCSLRKPFEAYLKDLATSQFVLSPRGAGLDCYRTWEALYLGAIPIVKASAMDAVFDDLPVLIIDDWKEITEQFLMTKLEEMKTKKYNFSKLDMAYWKQLIDSYKVPS
jgi:hypothetical protein